MELTRVRVECPYTHHSEHGRAIHSDRICIMGGLSYSSGLTNGVIHWAFPEEPLSARVRVTVHVLLGKTNSV